MLVIAEKEAAVALTLIAAHGIDADLLAAAIVVLTFIHICEKRERRGEETSHLELVGHRHNPVLRWLMKGLHRGAVQRKYVMVFCMAPCCDGPAQGTPGHRAVMVLHGVPHGTVLRWYFKGYLRHGGTPEVFHSTPQAHSMVFHSNPPQ